MGRNLISATLTDEAYECYQHWSSKRQGSSRLSESILLAFGRLNYVEAAETRNDRILPSLFIKILSMMNRAQWYQLRADDRELILRYAGGIAVLREYKVPWRLDDAPYEEIWDHYKQEFKEGYE